MMLRRPFDVHGVSSPDAYRAFHAATLAAQRVRAPHRNLPEPWICLVPRDVYVTFGKWLIRCVCGNAPSVSPEWRLACCLECGAVFESLSIPDDYQAIESMLLARPALVNQAWLQPETVDDLAAENAAHGVA